MNQRPWIAFSMILLVAASASALDRSGTVGVGYGRSVLMGEIGIEGGVIITVDGVSGRYWLNERSGVQAIFGFTSFEDTTGVVFSGRYLHGLIVKPFSMLYAFGGLDLDLLSTDDNDENWFGLGAGCGVEFCIPQLEELAFYGEIGLQYQDATGGSAFGTSGEAAGSFGFHYYL